MRQTGEPLDQEPPSLATAWGRRTLCGLDSAVIGLQCRKQKADVEPGTGTIYTFIEK